MKKLLFYFLLIFAGNAFAQAEINWLSFEQLEDSLQQEPKPVFIYFYADWCAYCKKMDRHAFKNLEVIQQLSNELEISITICHYPPGTSKWNKIEHRVFCHITALLHESVMGWFLSMVFSFQVPSSTL